MNKGGYAYILTNEHHTVLYVGATSDLKIRIWQHRTKAFANSYTAKYNCFKLVCFEDFPTIVSAIEREKQLKSWNRKLKEELINSLNPEWKDLWEVVQDW
jgi:putative endonuclease